MVGPAKTSWGKAPAELERLMIPVVVVLLALPALRPLLTAGYFEAHDSLLHLLRMVEFDAALGSGDLFPRWSPDLALGYGYPLFNYYPPLAYYLSQAFQVLGLGLGGAIKASMAAGLVLSGLGMYLFAKELLHCRPAALLSATAFVYLPYHLTDLYVRGALPEATLIALLPITLWAFRRLALRISPGYLVIGALLLAGVILSHVTFIFFLPILAGYFVVAALSLSHHRRRALLLGAAAFGLGVSLAAFYWLPVLLEMPYAAVARADWVRGDTIRSELLPLESLVRLSPSHDYQAEFPPRLAIVDLALAVCGLGIWLGRKSRRETLPAVVPFVALMPLLIFLLSEAALPFWQNMPLVSIIQFPWRVLAFVGLSSSVLGGLLARGASSPMPWRPLPAWRSCSPVARG